MRVDKDSVSAAILALSASSKSAELFVSVVAVLISVSSVSAAESMDRAVSSCPFQLVIAESRDWTPLYTVSRSVKTERLTIGPAETRLRLRRTATVKDFPIILKKI